MVKGMFVGNAKNSTNSVSKALGIFIFIFHGGKVEEEKKRKRKCVGRFDGVCLSAYVNVACLWDIKLVFGGV